jgi:hypothetical protein
MLHFFLGREQRLRALIDRLDLRVFDDAPCQGVDPSAYHPEAGEPDAVHLARCVRCDIRLHCLALALRSEPPDQRHGWYGGLGPDERDLVAATLHLGADQYDVPPRALEAARLRTEGLTIGVIAERLHCCRRTIQRYLRMVA